MHAPRINVPCTPTHGCFLPTDLQANLGFTLLFTGEMLTKWVGYGVALTPKAYLKSAWNCLDFVIVMISLVLLAADSFPQVEPAAPRT